ncbi:MAG TPA: threonine synthase [Bacteroidota bacterium]|nr:threonine synthase [Bacteroidota bacterium]
MRFCSTRDRGMSVSFGDAVRRGVPEDGGLFMPAEIPAVPRELLRGLERLTFGEIATAISRLFLEPEMSAADVEETVAGAITFDAPVLRLDAGTAVLELFHGPTLAFKDFGARFMARAMSRLLERGEESTVLVATSGDTGSAVASGFYGLPGISVVLLYPSGRVSPLQERQLTALRGNVTALEIGGTFDDCQRLVKQAFRDGEIAGRKRLTSANSINVARLLPQSLYYFNAVARLGHDGRDAVFSVPSGNLGNLTAGLIAWKMGLPAAHFVAAANANDVFTRFIATGNYEPAEARRTLSNAMDVGDPGNLPRIRALFDDDIGALRTVVSSTSWSDQETRRAIGEAFRRYGYVFDPHGAVAYAALEQYRSAHPGTFTGIVLATAHPAKFLDAYTAEVRRAIDVPRRLGEIMESEIRSVRLPAEFAALKEFLMES